MAVGNARDGRFKVLKFKLKFFMSLLEKNLPAQDKGGSAAQKVVTWGSWPFQMVKFFIVCVLARSVVIVIVRTEACM